MKKISACPSWLDLSEDRRSFVFVPEKADVVRKIFELCIGGLGSYAIAERLNRRKVSPFGPSPKWDNTTVDSMLRNKATFGEYQPKSWAGGSKKGVAIGAPISGYYPAVVDQSTFEAAQIARQRHLALGRGSKGKNFTVIFSGLATCAYCGSSVRLYRQSLVCEQVFSSSGCIRTAWSYANFERSVLYFLVHPALVERLNADQQRTMSELMKHVRQLSRSESYDLRVEIASLLKQAVSQLKVANAGSQPMPTLPGALIRTDNPQRFFEIKLRDGPSYVGIPMP